MFKQSWLNSHAETITQNIVGQIIAYCILKAFGIPVTEGLKMQLIFFITAYFRGYIIRRLFEKYK